MDKVEELLVLIEMLNISHYELNDLLVINDDDYKQFIINFLKKNNIKYRYTFLNNIAIYFLN